MDMTVMRGTTIPIVLTLTKFGDSEAMRLEGEAVIVFRIKSNPNQPGWMYQKILTSAHEQSPGVYAFNMLPSDTETWEYGEYYYDYGIQFSVNDYWPCMATSKFIVVESIAGRVNAADIQYAEIENGSVTTIKLHDGAVTIEKIHESVTPAALGAADREHNHDDLYYGVQEMDVIIEGVNKSIEANATVIEEFKGAGQIKNDNLDNNAVTTEKLSDNAVTAAKIASGAVSRSKLAQDALFSPVLAAEANTLIGAEHCGVTLLAGTETALSLSYNETIPVGAEFAVLNTGEAAVTIEAGLNTAILLCDGSAPETVTVTPYGMAAAKLISRDTVERLDRWYITGNAEVVG